MAEFTRRGKEAISEFITSSENEGKPITSIVYSLLLQWVTEVAREHDIPTTVLWIQPATVFDIYYFYFNGYESAIKAQANDSISKSECSIKLPGLPPLSGHDVPSFFNASNAYHSALSMFQELMEVLADEPNARILVNTFDAIEQFKMIAVGPLIQSSLDSTLRADIFQCNSNDYLQWLNSKPKSSVVYWAVRNQKARGEEETEEDKLSCGEELEQFGMIVPWCSQVEVLSHPSLGCFVTHCGWSSTLDSLVVGVPTVAFPQCSDQATNAKLDGSIHAIPKNNSDETLIQPIIFSRTYNSKSTG
ncbi:Detected protein of confused Function [Hibiscus syriacus]|uniref:Detected protein of confused Function n=1 Tax=Hibiscus syriacus TaxID=106335 RepID=A0A6A3D0E8_HIBSY|nr:Detected protein of confused Function [Hibiscus syriacus]